MVYCPRSRVCPICNSEEEFYWGDSFDGNFGDHDQISPDYCLNCKYVQSNPWEKPKESEALEFYRECWKLQINPYKEDFYKRFFASTIDFDSIDLGLN